jgi:ATP-dependent DNA helicase RecG
MNKLTPQDIQSIVQSGEGYNAEFKVRLPNKVKEISEEICAFARHSCFGYYKSRIGKEEIN